RSARICAYSCTARFPLMPVHRAIQCCCILHFSFLLYFVGSWSAGRFAFSLHDALPIYVGLHLPLRVRADPAPGGEDDRAALELRSEEHTSELQSRFDLVCRLLLEKKKTYVTDWSLDNQ